MPDRTRMCVYRFGMRWPIRMRRIHRIAGLLLIGGIAGLWLFTRWWYVKCTHRDPGGVATFWITSGRASFYVLRAPPPPPAPRRIGTSPFPAVVPAPPPTAGTTLEILSARQLSAIPGWQWGFDTDRRQFPAGGGEWSVAFPLWSVAGAVGILILIPTLGELRHRCMACGYDLRGIRSAVCPECGTAHRLHGP